MARLLAADNFSTTGRKMYHLSSVALAASVPVAIASPSASAVEKGADIIMALAIPWHSHVSLNAIVSDYVPRGALRSAARAGVLGSTLVGTVGLLSLAVGGPGITSTVKKLWK